MSQCKLAPLYLFVASALAISPMAQATDLMAGDVLDVNGSDSVNDITVNKNATLNINNGGISYGTVVGSAGIENVNEGGRSEGATLKTGGIQNVSGEVVNTTVGYGGAQYVDAGGIASNTVIYGGTGGVNGAQYLEDGALSMGTVIEGGNQWVLAGGHAIGTTINSGSQEVLSGGYAENSVIEGGTLSVSGVSDNAELNNGTLQVNVGGVANDSAIFGGSMIVGDGGVSNNTVGYDGNHQISAGGVSNDSEMNGNAYEKISADGVANSTVLNGNGQQYVYGTANNATINDSGLQVVGYEGTADGTLINSGEQRLKYGATATNTSVNGENALQYIAEGSKAIDTTINAGNQWVYGITNNNTLNGGLSTLFEGSFATGKTEINTGGQMLMHAGSRASDVTINGGILTVGAISDSGSVQAAKVGYLAMNGGTISFQENEGARYASLSIGKLSGTGNFMFNTSLADKSSNFVTIRQGSGSFGVAVNDSGKEIANHTDLTVNLINDMGGDIDFTLISTRGNNIRAVDGGAYMYVLKQEAGKDGLDGNVWHLGAMTDENNNNGNASGNQVTTPSTDAVLSLANAGLNIMRGEMDGLRAARQSQSSDRQHGEGSVWGHYLGKKSAAETSNGAAYKLYQNGMELGGDIVTDFGNSQLVTGGFVSLTGNNVKHARGGTSSVDSYGLGAYATWYDKSGLYLDGTLKANRLESQLSARMTNGDMTSGKWHQYGLSAALEAGYSFTSVDNLTVEPFARMTGTTINDANVKLNNGMTAKTGKARSLTAEAGSRLATDFSLGNTAFRPYLSVSVEQELAHSNESVINEVNRFKNHQNGTSGKYGAGITVSPAKDVTLYGELNYRQGSYVEEPVQGMAGIRISF